MNPGVLREMRFLHETLVAMLALVSFDTGVYLIMLIQISLGYITFVALRTRVWPVGVVKHLDVFLQYVFMRETIVALRALIRSGPFAPHVSQRMLGELRTLNVTLAALRTLKGSAVCVNINMLLQMRP